MLHLVAPGCATHAGRVEYGLRGPYGREGLRSQVRGRPGATRGFGRSPSAESSCLAAVKRRRVLDPIFRHLNSGGEWKQHGFFWKDYEVSSW